MSQPAFTRARSTGAKAVRQQAILDSATRLALARGVRADTLTDIAKGVGMHKSTMLRYFVRGRRSSCAWPPRPGMSGRAR